ncbi:hypothetical protein [Paenibacillus sp. AD87]|uniref:hypothetical protein n=1 Tax=Paenibacillus sp. AD87 TaxID=1528787 RepID=UPI001E60C5B8|nr:hypothetical protein [Paenibacillus sp. AD87]
MLLLSSQRTCAPAPTAFPVVGSRILVLTNVRGTTHVELDLSNGVVFEPDVTKYAAPDY